MSSLKKDHSFEKKWDPVFDDALFHASRLKGAQGNRNSLYSIKAVAAELDGS
jgi:hypothetical protein